MKISDNTHSKFPKGDPMRTVSKDHLQDIVEAGDNTDEVRKLLSAPESHGIRNSSLLTLCRENLDLKDVFLIVIGSPLAVASILGDEELILSLRDKGFTWHCDRSTELHLLRNPKNNSLTAKFIFSPPVISIPVHLRLANPEYYLLLCNLSPEIQTNILTELSSLPKEKRCFGRRLADVFRIHSSFLRLFGASTEDTLLNRLVTTLQSIYDFNRVLPSPSHITLCLDVIAERYKNNGFSYLLNLPSTHFFFKETLQSNNNLEQLFLCYSDAWLRGTAFLSPEATQLISERVIPESAKAEDREAFYGRLIYISTFADLPFSYLPGKKVRNRMLRLCKDHPASRSFWIRRLFTSITLSAPDHTSFSLTSEIMEEYTDKAAELCRPLIREYELDQTSFIRSIWCNPMESGDYYGVGTCTPVFGNASLSLQILTKLNQGPLVLHAGTLAERSLLTALAKQESVETVCQVLRRTIAHVIWNSEKEPVKKPKVSQKATKHDISKEPLWQKYLEHNSPELAVIALKKNVLPISRLEDLVDESFRLEAYRVIPFLYAEAPDTSS
jgi:hypothetical protein